MRYVRHIYTTLAELRIGEKVYILHRPHPFTEIGSSGVIASIDATSLRIAWNDEDAPNRDTYPSISKQTLPKDSYLLFYYS
jgi:hypothetical protein